jgi:hypothetical protein
MIILVYMFWANFDCGPFSLCTSELVDVLECFFTCFVLDMYAFEIQCKKYSASFVCFELHEAFLSKRDLIDGTFQIHRIQANTHSVTESQRYCLSQYQYKNIPFIFQDLCICVTTLS